MDVNALQTKYQHFNHSCYVVNITAVRGIWQSDNPWSQALPVLIIELTFVMAVNQLMYFFLKPFHVPRIASDIAAGVMFGKSALHRIDYVQMIFPIRGLIMTETVAYWALCLHLFLVGLSTDVSAVFRTGKTTTCFALICLAVPFLLGIVLFFFVKKETDYSTGCFFFGGALAVTGFPVVARVLTDLRIIHSDIGRIAMSASLVNDLASWVILSILLPSQVDLLNTFLSVALTLGFTAFCFFAVRPAMDFIIRKTSKEKTYSEHYLNFMLASVSLFACASDALGTSPMVGAFVYGLVMPSRDLAGKLLETFEDVVNEYLLPLYFTVCGMRVGLSDMGNWGVGGFLVILLAPFAKIVGALVASYFFEMSMKEGFALGAAMNGKNIVVIIILTMGFDGSAAYKAKSERPGNFISAEVYSIAMVSVFLMTAAMPFILGNLYRPAKRLSNYHGRTIQKARNEPEFRILTCFQGPENVSGIINLLDSSNATKDSPLSVFALNLVELTGRNSSMLIVHSTGKSSSSAHTGRKPHVEQIIGALDIYSSLNEGLVSVQSMTLSSPYPNMHEDICGLAEDKQVSLIILPFHKHPSPNGTLEDFEEGIHFRGVNLNVMANAPCTVGVFIDKGFGTTPEGESNLRTRHVAMVFIGGPDDREALAYASRISGTQGLILTVIRFLPGDNVEEYEPVDLLVGDAHRMLTSISYVDRQRRLDDEWVDEFRLKCCTSEQVNYVEKYANNEEETVAILKEMGSGFDLYIVGKGEGIMSPLTSGLIDWCEFQELGALGDLLVTSSFAQRGSVLVIQQYAGAGDLANLLAASSEEMSMRSVREQFGSWGNHEGEDVDRDDRGLELEPFARRNSSKKNADVNMDKDEADLLEKGF